MPSGVGDYGANQWISVLFGLTTPATTYYLALALRNPGNNVDGTMLASIEVVGGSYTRVAIGTGGTNWLLAGSGAVTNKNPLTFPTASQDWGTVNTWVLCTAVTAGDVYAYGDLPQSSIIRTGSFMQIPTGGLVILAGSQKETVVS